MLTDKSATPLPVLCIEDGKVILRFSEIFGIHVPLKKAEKRDHRYSVPKGTGLIYVTILNNVILLGRSYIS